MTGIPYKCPKCGSVLIIVTRDTRLSIKKIRCGKCGYVIGEWVTKK